MADLFGFVPIGDLDGHHAVVTLLKAADTEAALLSDLSYDPDQTGTRNVGDVTDLGAHASVRNSKTDQVVTAAVCSVR